MEERAAQSLSWDFVGRWMPPPRGSLAANWGALEAWVSAARDSAAAVDRELSHHVREWEEWLQPLGEVSAQDWRQFRPLRLGREEAWSDWVAHLLSRSVSGGFGRDLLSGHPHLSGVSTYARLSVSREVETPGRERRADLLVEWPDAVAHIEVKAGDREFEKTLETCRLLEMGYGRGRAWADFILLPPGDVEGWRSQAGDQASRVIHELTWRDVAVAARRGLKCGAESLHWRTWAHAFCGAVEQRILGCEPTSGAPAAGSALERFSAAVTLLGVMKEAEGT